MRIRHLKLKVLLAVSVVAMLALPGEAKPVVQEGAVAQAAFGPLADPHVVPALHIELPAGYWTL
jgi:hypothetical protein